VGGSDAELIHSALDAFNRRDLDAVLELCDPEIEIHDPERTGAVFRGRERLLEFWAEWLENWETYTVELRDLRETDGGFLAICRQAGTGKASGIEIEDSIFQYYRIRDGRFVEYRIFADRDHAFRSVGLEP